ncbi:ABC transporter substrate-binding protein [Nonomuraea sp. NPDC049269]|uniref:ABC transporter substrate-binding protein n=1 Tax=Nonomuraea sp. NPDC049269 TaxID=3364349 RepID=UPI00372456D7
MRFVPLAAAGLAILSLAACTAGKEGGPALGSQSKPANAAPTALPAASIELWHGFSADSEVKAFTDAIAGFNKKYPQIKVKLVKGVQDEQITQAVRGGRPPDVASSFTTDSVATWCKSGVFQDLNPVIKQDGVDLSGLPAVVNDYTQYEGKRCVMPLLTDAYGLYYNKALMKGHQPPKTLSELTKLAKELTVRNPDGTIKVAGFIPSGQYYENTAGHWSAMVGAKWTNPDGTSAIGSDPAWKTLLKWQKDLIDWYGYANLDKFRKGLGDEFSGKHPFYQGKVAMGIDGEWRVAMIANEAPKLDYGTAPMPVDDSKPDLYGSGFTAGTVIGVPKGAKNPEAAWALVKYLTTDTDALVTLANAIRNVPTTRAALESPALKKDEHFQTFLDIFANPKTSTIPAHVNSVFNQEALQGFITSWEKGSVKDLDAGLKGVDKTIDAKFKLSGG